MKKNILRSNIKILLVVFVVMFVGLIVFLGYVDVTYGEKWFATAYNPRIQNLETTIDVGDVLDRTGADLVYTQDGEREYIGDKDTRLAIAHVIGDEYGMSYGAQIMYAKYLYGFDKNAITRIVDLMSGEERTGSDVTLTIDADLCKTAMAALGDYNGAVVVMNYKTGEILASVAAPSFDPTDMTEFLEGGGDSELVNRATSGLYPPGSIFKLITAAALIENDMADFTTTCTGSTNIAGEVITCTEEHGKIDLAGAIEHSCNVYFSEAAQALGVKAIETEANRFLFNTPFLYSDVSMSKSVFEASSNPGEAAWSAIGQYHDLITPLHACMIAACIANDGVMMEPKQLLSVSNSAGQSYALSPAVAATPLSDTDALKEMMVACVKSGTGTAAQIKGVTVGGKTGTAQVDGQEDTAWFVGFVEDEQHPLAVAVVMEQAGSGGRVAAPAAKKVLEKAMDLGY